ncbi:MAG: N-carbamoyl-D-amino-acid hydrolase [Acidobacteria bacterium]|nr:N-carbamoyl-D-amino-acid hydrolase [Acidobacteriota bacterium]
MRILRVAAAQVGGIQPDETRAQVVERLLALMERAAGAGCGLVVFPELTLTTFFPRYFLEDTSSADAYFEAAMPGPETRSLFDASRRLGVGFHLGYAERVRDGDRSRHFNTAILVDGGEIIGKYRKVHLPGHAHHLPEAPFQHLEKRYFEVGDLGFPVWRAFDGVFGMCICNDRRWPETYRVLGLQGVEMILLGYNTPEVNIHHREPAHLRMFHHRLSLQAGAYQNATWVVAAAKCGVEDGSRLIAGSAIVSPNGEIVAESAGEGDELIVADCDLDVGTDLKRHVFDFARHRRTEHYGLITERTAPLPPG